MTTIVIKTPKNVTIFVKSPKKTKIIHVLQARPQFDRGEGLAYNSVY